APARAMPGLRRLDACRSRSLPSLRSAGEGRRCWSGLKRSPRSRVAGRVEGDRVALRVAENGDEAGVADVGLGDQQGATGAANPFEAGVELPGRVEVDEGTLSGGLPAAVLDEGAARVGLPGREDGVGDAPEDLALELDAQDLLVEADGPVQVLGGDLEPGE